jgi:hypothetical protein
MANTTVSLEVLEETPARGARFIQAIVASPIIRTIMARAGMATEDLAEGRSMLLDCLGANLTPALEAETEQSKTQQEAAAELDLWDEPNFMRFGATLKRYHPSAYDYVFENLKASTGSQSVAGVATFLLRVQKLEDGSDAARAATRKDDQRAVERLDRRGLTTAERKRLKKLVDVALGPTDPLKNLPAEDETRDAERVEKLREFRDWFEEWSTVARAVVKKRSYLIRMGLASRRSPGTSDEDTGEAGGGEPGAGEGSTGQGGTVTP